MDDAHLEKLRRFALASGTLLFVYLVAGIVIKPDADISVFGFPFRIARPDLLPLGLAAASFLGALRFQYYGIWLATSPHRRRRDLIDSLMVHFKEYIRDGRYTRKESIPRGCQIPTYWGPRRFTTSPSYSDRGIVERLAAAFDNAFPKFLGARASANIESHESCDEDGREYFSYCIDVVIPRRCRLAALLEDLDYTSPVWWNVLVLALFVPTII